MNRKTFRLFISSTFSDFRQEREILQTKVFPKIKSYCVEKGYKFQPIDLRWGVNQEAQLDQKTLERCLNEARTWPTPPILHLHAVFPWTEVTYVLHHLKFNNSGKEK